MEVCWRQDPDSWGPVAAQIKGGPRAPEASTSELLSHFTKGELRPGRMQRTVSYSQNACD